MLKKSILLTLLITPFLNASDNSLIEKIKAEKEMDYSLIVNKKVKGIQFEKDFIKIVFEDGKVFCENDTIIADNCNFILNKKEVLNHTYSTNFTKEVIKKDNLKKFVLLPKEANEIYYVFQAKDLNTSENFTKLNSLKDKVNIVLVPTSIEDKILLEKYFSLKIEDKNYEEMIELYKSFKEFSFPATVVIKAN